MIMVWRVGDCCAQWKEGTSKELKENVDEKNVKLALPQCPHSKIWIESVAGKSKQKLQEQINDQRKQQSVRGICGRSIDWDLFEFFNFFSQMSIRNLLI